MYCSQCIYCVIGPGAHAQRPAGTRARCTRGWTYVCVFLGTYVHRRVALLWSHAACRPAQNTLTPLALFCTRPQAGSPRDVSTTSGNCRRRHLSGGWPLLFPFFLATYSTSTTSHADSEPVAAAARRPRFGLRAELTPACFRRLGATGTMLADACWASCCSSPSVLLPIIPSDWDGLSTRACACWLGRARILACVFGTSSSAMGSGSL